MAAAAGCVFHRTLTRSGPNQTPIVCREQLLVLDVQRYTRDQSSSVCFPQSVLLGEDLYDVTLFDGDCCLRASLDPTLNRFVEKHVLRQGSVVRSATFSRGLSLQLPQSPDSLQLPQPSAAQDSDHTHHTDSFSLVGLDIVGLQKNSDLPVSLSWFRSSWSRFPLRAKRSVFLPLWNNTDHHGDAWRDAPPTEEDGAESHDEGEEPEEEVEDPSCREETEGLDEMLSSPESSSVPASARTWTPTPPETTAPSTSPAYNHRQEEKGVVAALVQMQAADERQHEWLERMEGRCFQMMLEDACEARRHEAEITQQHIEQSVSFNQAFLGTFSQLVQVLSSVPPFSP